MAKTRYQVSGRNSDGDLVSRNIRYTEDNAKKFAKKLGKRKNIKTVKVEKTK